MRVLITGVGDAFTARSFGTSAVIETAGGHVMIDCPDPIHRVLREAGERSGWRVDATTLRDVILTHLHGDHSNGLESLGFSRRILRRDDPAPLPRLHAAPPVAARVWEKLAPAMDAPPSTGGAASVLGDYYELHELAPDQAADVAGLSVRCRRTGHPIPTFGLLVSDGTSTLGWSSDTPFERAHVDWLAQADIIVHECNHGPAHTPLADLHALPAEIRRRMHLIHLPDDFDEAGTDLRILRQGEVLEI